MWSVFCDCGCPVFASGSYSPPWVLPSPAWSSNRFWINSACPACPCSHHSPSPRLLDSVADSSCPTHPVALGPLQDFMVLRSGPASEPSLPGLQKMAFLLPRSGASGPLHQLCFADYLWDLSPAAKCQPPGLTDYSCAPRLQCGFQWLVSAQIISSPEGIFALTTSSCLHGWLLPTHRGDNTFQRDTLSAPPPWILPFSPAHNGHSVQSVGRPLPLGE
jgi:hypothetical protein